MINKVHIDFETFSTADIKKCGAWAYAKHPATRVLCMAYAVDNQEVKVTTDTQEIRQLITFWLLTDCQLVAWNSFFEMAICYNVLNIKESLNVEQWIDPSARASYLTLPRNLSGCAVAVGLTKEHQKDTKGKSLINKLCKPYRGEIRNYEELFNDLLEYCKQDVVAEREIYKKIGDLPQQEREIWLLDQKINVRGVRVDIANVEHALYLVEVMKEQYNTKACELSGGAITKLSKNGKVINFLNSLGCSVKSLNAEHRRNLLSDENTPTLAKQIITLLGHHNKTSTAKYESLRTLTCGGRARGLLAYHGANTGRWSGRLFQPQNLPRPSFKDTDGCVELFKERDCGLLAKRYGEPMECLSSCLRSMLIPSAGCKFAIANYSAIEARVLPWLANQKDILEVFKNGEDIYKYQAGKIYGKDYKDIDREERFIGKIATLALGYGGGKKAFSSMAGGYNVDIPEELAEEIKVDWRGANNNIVSLWRSVEGAVKNVIRASQQKNNGCGITQQRVGNLIIALKGSFIDNYRKILL